MKGRKLFFKRLFQEWRYQLGVIRSVVDWTILVYLVVPALVLAPFLYRDAWEYIELYWSAQIPFPFLLLVILLFSSGGNFRTYLLEADLLHLIQRKRLLHALKLAGFLLSLAQLIIGVALIVIIALPVLILIYQFSTMEVLHLSLAIIAFRLLFLTLKKIITRNLYKWILFPMFFVLTLGLIVNLDSVIVGIGGSVCAIAIVIFHLTQLTKTNRWFLRELEIESAEVTRYIKLIFAFSMEVEKEFVSTRKRPFWFYRKSGRIFAARNSENGLLELLLKAFLRNRGHVTTYLQLTMITSSAIIVLPIWLKWIVYLLFLFFFHIWLMSIFDKMQTSPFFSVVPFEKDQSHSVWIRFKKRLYLPSIVFVGLVAVFASLIDMVISLVF